MKFQVNTSVATLLLSAIAQTTSSQHLRGQSWQATAEKATKVQSFVMEGVELNLSSGEVAGDFCDAASPLSLAGYMNGEFLLCYYYYNMYLLCILICK